MGKKATVAKNATTAIDGKTCQVDAKSNMQKMHNANSDKPVALYSLDIILAVGA